MIQKWDYKTIRSTRGSIGQKFEIDGVPAAEPENIVSLFKELGQEGWELATTSIVSVESPAASMTPEELKAFSPLIEDGKIHALRMPSSVYWWVFKRPLPSHQDPAQADSDATR